MKISADPVRDYLSAVEREASTLPADRHQELLADLAEHIEVARAERPDTAIGEVLTELGDPRTIAATALAEAGNGAAGTPARDGAPARHGKAHPLVPLLMLTLPFLLAAILPHAPAAQFCSTLFRVIGAVLLLHLGALDLCPEDHGGSARRRPADRRHQHLDFVRRRPVGRHPGPPGQPGDARPAGRHGGMALAGPPSLSAAKGLRDTEASDGRGGTAWPGRPGRSGPGCLGWCGAPRES